MYENTQIRKSHHTAEPTKDIGFPFAQLAMTYYNSKWILFGFQILLIGAVQYEKKLYNKRCQENFGTTDKQLRYNGKDSYGKCAFFINGIIRSHSER